MYLIVGYAIGASEVEGPEPYIGFIQRKNETILPGRKRRRKGSPVSFYVPAGAESDGDDVPYNGLRVHQRETNLKF